MTAPGVSRPTTPLEWTVVFLAMGFGTGRIRYAPGTWGSVLGVIIAWGLHQTIDPVRWTLSLAMVVVGIPLCGVAARILGQKDPGRVVWDEMAALQIVFLMVPVTLATAVVGFLLFRVVDIWKPWPIERFEQLPGGLGIMIDDVLAGIPCAIVLLLLSVWGLLGT